MSKEKSGLGFVFGLLVGGLVGASVAVILTPQSGPQTRSELQKRADKLKTKAKDFADDFKGDYSGWVEKSRKFVDDKAREVSDVIKEKIAKSDTDPQNLEGSPPVVPAEENTAHSSSDATTQSINVEEVLDQDGTPDKNNPL